MNQLNTFQFKKLYAYEYVYVCVQLCVYECVYVCVQLLESVWFAHERVDLSAAENRRLSRRFKVTNAAAKLSVQPASRRQSHRAGVRHA